MPGGVVRSTSVPRLPLLKHSESQPEKLWTSWKKSGNVDIQGKLDAIAAKQAIKNKLVQTTTDGKKEKANGHALTATDMARYGKFSYPVSLKVTEAVRHWGRNHGFEHGPRPDEAVWRDTHYNAENELVMARVAFGGANKVQEDSWVRSGRVAQERVAAAKMDEVRKGWEDYCKFTEVNTRHVAKSSIMNALLERLPFTTGSYKRFYSVTMKNFRYIVMEDKVLLNGFRDMLNRAPQVPKNLKMSTPVEGPADAWVDFFVSHSWDDPADEKFAVLLELSKRFEDKYDRKPRFWIDKFCINTDRDAEVNLRCIPGIMMASAKLLVLHSKTYTRRLWCLAELALYVGTSTAEQDEYRIEMIELGDHLQPTYSKVDVDAATCYNEDDEPQLRAMLDAIPSGVVTARKWMHMGLKRAYQFRNRGPPNY
jgi:hypothetical protein